MLSGAVAARAAAWTRRPLLIGDLLRVDAYGSVGGCLSLAGPIHGGSKPNDAPELLT